VSNLRAAPPELTPDLAGRFIALADLVCGVRRDGGGQILPGQLPEREIDGSYPFRSHPTVAETWAQEGSD